MPQYSNIHFPSKEGALTLMLADNETPPHAKASSRWFTLYTEGPKERRDWLMR
jgi:hypothetical protein